MKRVLVAGATGYLGKFVVQEFKERGYWVRVLARNPQKLGEIGPFGEPAVKDRVDEIFVGEVTKPATLHGLSDGIDIVFSSIGITRQRDKLTYREVDYQGNKNLLDIAREKSVEKFIYVSIFKAHMLEYLEIIKAHEDLVRDLKDSGLNYAVIRPTGYFADMSEFLKMARAGRVYLIGQGENRLNPIHAADVARVCVDAVTSSELEVPVGGPVTYSMGEIAELAFATLGKEPKITRIPPWTANLVARLIRPFNQQMAGMAEFFIAVGQNDGVAPATGRQTLKSYFEELASYREKGDNSQW